MSLVPGSRIGVYEVVGLIGAGGMGEVYRARDARLSRDVAVKVLPDVTSGEHDSVARFEREARALATLSHPNIATIHGVEEVATAPGQPTRKALILEFVEGETLAERLHDGPLTEQEALGIATQIAEALASAHDKGIMHRDLKPANIKVTPDGHVKVLDFGLARIAAEAGAPQTTVTMTGAILGTPAYMAPEQAQGKAADKRADIWAFGVVLYEMLAGVAPFRAESVQGTLANVLTREPDWGPIPPRLQPLLQRCLERDPSRRLRSVGDFRFLIDVASGTPDPVRSATSVRTRALTGAVIAALALAAAWGWLRPAAQAPREPIRVTAMLPSDVSATRGPGFAPSLAISPDGRTIVVAGTGRDGPRLYTRSLARVEATPLAGTERGSSPFFSWDGAWVGFFADGRLKRVPSAGGAAVDIVAVPAFPVGASWGPDDRIVFAYGPDAEMRTVRAAGGSADVLSGAERGAFPQILPDGSTVLYEWNQWIHAVDISTGRSAKVVEGSAPRYADGQLVLSRGTTLLAAPFDLARRELTGAVVPVVEGVAIERGSTGVPRHYALSRNGTLVYVPAPDRHALVIREPDGTERLVAEQRTFENPRFSPDGHRVVAAGTRRDGELADLWLYDLRAGGSGTRLTFGGGRAPVWTPDGATVTYSHLGEHRGIYELRVDGSGKPARLIDLGAFHWLVGWSPDRGTLLYGLMENPLSSIFASRGGEARRVVGPGSTWGGRLSRDGRWLAYYLLESGNFEIYVTRFPEGGTRWLIAQGTDPAWGPDGNDVYYRSGSRLMAARVDKTSGVRVVSHRVVLEPFLPPQYDDYDIHPNGRTLAVVRPAGSVGTREVTVVLDWLSELRAPD